MGHSPKSVLANKDKYQNSSSNQERYAHSSGYCYVSSLDALNAALIRLAVRYVSVEVQIPRVANAVALKLIVVELHHAQKGRCEVRYFYRKLLP